MPEIPKTPFDFPADMLALTERSIDDARAAFERMMDVAQTTLGAAEARGKAAQEGVRGISAKVMEFAERNVADAFAYAQKLVQARDPQTLVQLHTEFVQTQMRTLSEQARALAEVTGEAAGSTVGSGKK